MQKHLAQKGSYSYLALGEGGKVCGATLQKPSINSAEKKNSTAIKGCRATIIIIANYKCVCVISRSNDSQRLWERLQEL